MKIILSILGVLLALYVAFVVVNTYIYAEKQEVGSFLKGQTVIQWGF